MSVCVYEGERKSERARERERECEKERSTARDRQRACQRRGAIPGRINVLSVPLTLFLGRNRVSSLQGTSLLNNHQPPGLTKGSGHSPTVGS